MRKLEAGARVVIVAGARVGHEGTITKIVESLHGNTRYDVSCWPGRWYFAYELKLVAESDATKAAGNE